MRRMSLLTVKNWRGPGVGLLFLVVWLCLWPTQSVYWDLLAGWRFGMFLLLPVRYWPWLIVGECLADTGGGLLFPGDHPVFILDVAADTLLGAGCVGLARMLGVRASLKTPERVVQFLAAAALTSMVLTTVATALLLLRDTGPQPVPVAAFFGGHLLGNYLGVLLILPILVLLTDSRPDRAMRRRLLVDGVAFLLPVLVVLFALIRNGPPAARFAPTLALAPVLYFAFRHGWRGTAASMLVVSVAMTVFTLVTTRLSTPAQAHLFLAVAGSAALMLGSGMDALRRSSHDLSVQNARLETANERLDELAQQLSDVARRNLRSEEEQRRYMAAELHDELGQNLTAIQTRMKLAQSRLQSAGLHDVSEAINDIIAHMRNTVRRMLDSLRPNVLDEFGLDRALEDGPIRNLLDAAGIGYRVTLYGEAGELDEDTRVAIYRIAQEAATNVVRHAGANHLFLRLRMRTRAGQRLSVLTITDDGAGLPPTNVQPSRSYGLQSMRDRVTALGGVFHIQSGPGGTRLHALLRTALPAPPTAADSAGETAPRNLSDTTS